MVHVHENVLLNFTWAGKQVCRPRRCKLAVENEVREKMMIAADKQLINVEYIILVSFRKFFSPSCCFARLTKTQHNLDHFSDCVHFYIIVALEGKKVLS